MDRLIISNSYRNYVSTLLFIALALNFLDRQLVAILLQPIKMEFNLSDGQMGMITGFAFALFYTSLAFPIARIADRGHRVTIISASLFVWSLLTFLTGLVSGYWQLFLARIGTGLGEAGYGSTALSLISDYFPKEKRGRAFAINQMGLYAGIALSYFMGGWIAQVYGWRMAFFIAGVPGIILAVITKLTLKSIPRGFSDNHQDVIPQPSLKQTFRNMWKQNSFVHLVIGAGVHAILFFGIFIFSAAFLMRSHGMTISQAGASLSILTFFGGGLGMYFAGWYADKKFQKSGNSKVYLWVPCVAVLLSIPAMIGVIFIDNTMLMLIFLMVYLFFISMYTSPVIVLVQRLVSLRERAAAVALLFFVMHMLGLGLGPAIVGYLSDLLSHWMIQAGADPQFAVAEGLRYSFLSSIIFALWSASHYFLASRTLIKDLASVE